ncbi:hypothetical protein TSOC_010194 [Tetrabaena socialis]|uniref:Uncharacterized protein n=1 Tax=Tetrabaena socialis TaxID=47790 RepID=A0A2J7ZTZ9_9CHLO|nr:hypothetical protein TSOC_010194 [Tetrabaena socialis]|eukprot:PNH03718.1 hypothetical protein TSOC_010194 [Tetrabaena socialis]
MEWAAYVVCSFLVLRGAWGLEVAEPLAMIGFHEGTKRVVSCGSDGVITGVEVGYVEDSWSFGEPFIGSVRLLCSSKKISIQYLPEQDDTYLFGRLALKTTRKVECEGTLGVAGFRWRKAGVKNPDGAEMRQAGLVVLCNRADNSPSELILEHNAASSHTYDNEFSCKKVTKYAGLAAPRLTKAILWWNRKSFAALEPTECA